VAVVNKEQLMNILLEPRVTEKSTRLGDKHKQFVFKVAIGARKPEIRQAVEQIFDVKVESVQVCNTKGKRKVFRYAPGRRSDWKKAYVRLKPGFDINFTGE
jgi:large subunit ribosomal protein L23